MGWARRSGAHKVALQVWPHNVAARRLYEKHGFVQEGLLRRHYRRRNGELWDAVVMGMVLDEESPGSSRDEGQG
jgi:RimJ/RimL family protein N-acetyltransferase